MAKFRTAGTQKSSGKRQPGWRWRTTSLPGQRLSLLKSTLEPSVQAAKGSKRQQPDPLITPATEGKRRKFFSSGRLPHHRFHEA